MAMNLSTFTDLSQLPRLVNTSTDSLFWAGLIHALFGFLLWKFSDSGMEAAFLIAGAVSFVFAIPLAVSGLINPFILGEFLAVVLLDILYIIYSQR